MKGHRKSSNLVHAFPMRPIAPTNMYTVSQSKTPMQSFCDNFGKYGPILIILSPLHPSMNSGKKLLYNPPPHLRHVATLPCEN